MVGWSMLHLNVDSASHGGKYVAVLAAFGYMHACLRISLLWLEAHTRARTRSITLGFSRSVVVNGYEPAPGRLGLPARLRAPLQPQQRPIPKQLAHGMLRAPHAAAVHVAGSIEQHREAWRARRRHGLAHLRVEKRTRRALRGARVLGGRSAGVPGNTSSRFSTIAVEPMTIVSPTACRVAHVYRSSSVLGCLPIGATLIELKYSSILTKLSW